MKLLIITALKEYSDQASAILKNTGINVFSATDIIGFKEGTNQNLLDNWFGAGDARFDSILLFSFTGNEQAVIALKFVQEYNQTQGSDFPIRAFILPVDQFSH